MQCIRKFAYDFHRLPRRWPPHSKKRTRLYELFQRSIHQLAIGYRLSAIGYRLSAIGYRLIFGLLLGLGALHAQAQCTYFNDFKDNSDGTVTDPRNGLIWKRCAEGSSYVNGDCTVAGTQASWIDAMQMAKTNRFLGKSDWRIPTKLELEQVVGAYQSCKSNKRTDYAASPIIAHSVRSDGYKGYFWSSSPDVGHAQLVWVVNFANSVYDYGFRYGNRISAHYVRLVRAGQLLGGEAALEFNREYAERVAPLVAAREAEERQQHEEEERKQRQQREEENQQREDERKFKTTLAGKNPQALYLAAGTYFRNGESGRASALYESIIERFPTSDWAVKANDQLNASKRVGDSNSAANARQAQAAKQAQDLENQARQRDFDRQRASEEANRVQQSQCYSRKSSCESTCSRLQGNAYSSCKRSCNSIC